MLVLVAVPAATFADTDVRIVIDVSGSMKQSDPDNLRRPALTILTSMLPADSKAGVWTFGQYVNMLVKHGDVNGAWKEQVRIRADSIGSVALRTNMGAALEQVSWDLDSDSRRERHVVLLTDGRVDVSDDDGANAAESERILKELLPGLVDRGVKVHTLALSSAADVNFLKQLSLATGGYHGAVESADQLADFFLKALANAAPPSEVVLDDSASFLIDDSVSEFTALLRGAGSDAALLSPDGERLTASRPGTRARWFRDASFDLITVRRPAAGRWQASIAEADGGRVSIVSDLELMVGAVPATISPGYAATVTLALKDSGAVISDEALLSVVALEATLQRGDAEPEALLVSPPMAADGLYQLQLGPIQQPGEYVLQVRAVAPTFTRAKLAVVTLRDPVGLRVEATSGTSADVVVEIADANIDFASLSLIGKVSSGDGPVQLVPLGAPEAGVWRLPVSVDSEDVTYSIVVDIKGKYLNGETFSLSTQPLEVALPDPQAQQVALDLSGDLLRDDTPEAEEPVREIGAPESQPTQNAQAQNQPTATDAEPEPQPEPIPWLLIGGSALATLAVGLLGTLAWGWLRRRRVAAADNANESEEAPEASEDPFEAVLGTLTDSVDRARDVAAKRAEAASQVADAQTQTETETEAEPEPAEADEPPAPADEPPAQEAANDSEGESAEEPAEEAVEESDDAPVPEEVPEEAAEEARQASA